MGNLFLKKSLFVGPFLYGSHEGNKAKKKKKIMIINQKLKIAIMIFSMNLNRFYVPNTLI